MEVLMLDLFVSGLLPESESAAVFREHLTGVGVSTLAFVVLAVIIYYVDNEKTIMLPQKKRVLLYTVDENAEDQDVIVLDDNNTTPAVDESGPVGPVASGLQRRRLSRSSSVGSNASVESSCNCCFSRPPECQNMDELWFGLAKHIIEAYTSLILGTVGLYGLLYCDRWQVYCTCIFLSTGSFLHHLTPRYQSKYHRLDNQLLGIAAIIFMIPMSITYWIVLGLAVWMTCLLSISQIKVVATVAIVFNYIWAMTVLSPPWQVVATIWGLASLMCYGCTEAHWSVHSIWHFAIAFFVMGVEQGLPPQ
eukprot:GFYU01006460.1.p1 GENE.GFYU01006460.1~~GFYU01006460.1.p1  ORF type:complete len:306 (-),score=29.91 GFYU01006460.1:28-945(-)